MCCVRHCTPVSSLLAPTSSPAVQALQLPLPLHPSPSRQAHPPYPLLLLPRGCFTPVRHSTADTRGASHCAHPFSLSSLTQARCSILRLLTRASQTTFTRLSSESTCRARDDHHDPLLPPLQPLRALRPIRSRFLAADSDDDEDTAIEQARPNDQTAHKTPETSAAASPTTESAPTASSLSPSVSSSTVAQQSLPSILDEPATVAQPTKQPTASCPLPCFQQVCTRPAVRACTYRFAKVPALYLL